MGTVHGLRRVIARARRRSARWLADVWMDRVTAMDTRIRVSERELGFGAGHRGYQASGWRNLRRAIDLAAVTSEDVFVDFGCGKGRVLYAAARHPFGRVIGVEVSERLAAIGRANMERQRHRFRCPRVEIVVADVLEFAIPDDLTVAYLFNPFQCQVVEEVARRIGESVRRRPRRVQLVYAEPVCREILEDHGFTLVRARPQLAVFEHRGDHLPRSPGPT